MKHERKALIVIVILLACAVVLSLATVFLNTSDQAKEDKYTLVKPGTLTVAASLDYPPFESQSDNGPAGYDVAVIQEVAKRLGLSCEIRDANFAYVIPSVAVNKTCDVAISALAITQTRQEQVDFTDPYYIGEQAIVTLKGTYQTSADLEDTVVAACSETSGYDYAKNSLSARGVVGYSSAQGCLNALVAGNVSAAVLDYPVAKALISQDYPACVILERVATNEQCGIAVNKNNRPLTDAINDVLADMENDGTLASLQQQYLG